MTGLIWRAALAGALSAAAVDFRAFKAWQSFHDAATYDWQTAAWRWAQGAIVGALSAVGVGAL